VPPEVTVAERDVEEGDSLLELDPAEVPAPDEGSPALVEPEEPVEREESELSESSELVPVRVELMKLALWSEWPGISVATATANPTERAEAPNATPRASLRTRLWALSRARAPRCARAEIGTSVLRRSWRWGIPVLVGRIGEDMKSSRDHRTSWSSSDHGKLGGLGDSAMSLLRVVHSERLRR
jgi:hypothetical protein